MNMREKVLIIDDDEQLADILSILLESEGYEVTTAATAAGGWEAFQRMEPSLVLLDLRLGSDSGLELLPRLRERDPHVPIFMITAHGDVDSAVEALPSASIFPLTILSLGNRRCSMAATSGVKSGEAHRITSASGICCSNSARRPGVCAMSPMLTTCQEERSKTLGLRAAAAPAVDARAATIPA